MAKDFRGWLDILRANKLLEIVDVEVDWCEELSAITRVNLAQNGPGLLFNNITDYQNTLCRQMATCTAATGKHIRLLLDLPADLSDQSVVAEIYRRYRNPIKPLEVESGPVKENILKGHDIDLEQIPAPLWSRLDGGRYIDTFGAVVTRDPEIGQLNVGIYRGMLLGKGKIGKLIVPSQHWGQHFAKHGKDKPMPVSIVYGAHDALPLCASTPFPKDICEYDMAGGILREAMELIKCETNDLMVPANAEMVIEGFISADPDTFEMEGPFSEYPGYSGGMASPKPVFQVTCITHRNDPIFRGAQEGARPGFPSEDGAMCAYFWSACVWFVIERQGLSGITDVHLPPVATGTNVVVQIKKRYHGMPQQIAAALWSNSSASFFYKNVMVVDEDIDIRDAESLEWARAYRVDAANGQFEAFGPTPGSPLDPSSTQESQKLRKYGSGTWTRTLIDATRTFCHDPNPDWGGRSFAPVAVMPEDLEMQVAGRWADYGIDVPYLNEKQRDTLTYRGFKEEHADWLPDFPARKRDNY